MNTRTIVITGASRGLGLGMARFFADAGHRLALCARGAIPLSGPEVLTAAVDVTRPDQVDGLARQAEERFGAIDLWINNAGILGPIAFAETMDAADFAQVLNINVAGVFLGSKAYLAHLRRQGQRGVLLNVSSGAAQKAYAGWSAYCASKAAVDMFTRVFQEEAGDAVDAWSVAPGVIDTDMQATIRSCSADDFPAVQRFHDLKAQEAFNTPEHVARELFAIAFDPARRPDDVVCRVNAQA